MKLNKEKNVLSSVVLGIQLFLQSDFYRYYRAVDKGVDKSALPLPLELQEMTHLSNTLLYLYINTLVCENCVRSCMCGMTVLFHLK